MAFKTFSRGKAVRLRELVDRGGLSVLTGRAEPDSLEAEVTGIIVGDVLSNVMHRAKHGQLWITVRCTPNVIALAAHKKLAGVIIAESQVDDFALNLAEREGVPLFAAGRSVFDTAGLLWALMNPSSHMMKSAACDLHMHTCLSPCAEDEMAPEAIVETALERDLDVIAVCDHNSAENVGQVILAAAGAPLLVIPGIEVTTEEEVHIVLLFPTAEQALKMQEIVYAQLDGKKNDPLRFGSQRVVDRHGRTLRLVEYMLTGRTSLKAVEAIKHARALGGMVIAAHVDRPIFSVATKFGCIPPEMDFDAVEVSPNAHLGRAREFFPEFPVVTSSDAHTLGEIGRVRTQLRIEGLDFRGVREALLARRFGREGESQAPEAPRLTQDG